MGGFGMLRGYRLSAGLIKISHVPERSNSLTKVRRIGKRAIEAE